MAEDESCDENKKLQYFVISNVLGNENSELNIPLNVKGKLVPALVDLGSPVNLIGPKHVKGNIRKSSIRLYAANNTKITNLGTNIVQFVYKGKSYEEEFIVTNEITKEIILGFKFCLKEKAKINFSMKERLEFRGDEKPNDLGEHKILTTTEEPIVSPSYRLGPVWEKRQVRSYRSTLKKE